MSNHLCALPLVASGPVFLSFVRGDPRRPVVAVHGLSVGFGFKVFFSFHLLTFHIYPVVILL